MALDSTDVELGQAQLFLDDGLVERSENVRRVWHGLVKHPGNPVMERSEWEDSIYLFGTVIREPDPLSDWEYRFRMWYYARGFGHSYVAYASSLDGLHWEKPDLKVVKIGGKWAHNAVFIAPGKRLLGLSGVLSEGETGARSSYKLMIPASIQSSREKVYLMASSPDGIHWDLVDEFSPGEPCKPDRACFTWSPSDLEYRLYCRTRHDPPELVSRGGPAYRGRAVALCRSPDFDTWSEPDLVLHADEDDPDGTELYGMAAFPYGGQWIGLVQVHRSLPHLAYLDLGICHSRDGIGWVRERDLVLPKGGVGEWDRFNQCASTQPIIMGNEIWVYYSGRLRRHGEYHRMTDLTDTGPNRVGIGLATLRLDGWCSLQSSFDGGEVLTRPLVLPVGASGIRLNAKSTWGEVVVEILDEEGMLLGGLQSGPVSADGVDLEVDWNRGTLEPVTGIPVRIRFHLKNALLYSWRAV
jgi:hypothetical protein